MWSRDFCRTQFRGWKWGHSVSRQIMPAARSLYGQKSASPRKIAYLQQIFVSISQQQWKPTFFRFPNFRQMTPWNHRNRESKENKVAEVLETILQICYIHKMMKLWSLKECFMKRCLSKSCKVFNSSYVTMRVEASPNIIDAEANFWSFCCSEHKPFNYSGVFSKGRGIKSLERLRGHKNGRRSSEGQAFLITWPSP